MNNEYYLPEWVIKRMAKRLSRQSDKRFTQILDELAIKHEFKNWADLKKNGCYVSLQENILERQSSESHTMHENLMNLKPKSIKVKSIPKQNSMAGDLHQTTKLNIIGAIIRDKGENTGLFMNDGIENELANSAAITTGTILTDS